MALSPQQHPGERSFGLVKSYLLKLGNSMKNIFTVFAKFFKNFS